MPFARDSKSKSVLLVIAVTAVTAATLPSRATAQPIAAQTREIPDGEIDYTPAVPEVSPQSGDYAATVPLEILPGIRGHVPEVTLVYSSKRANGPLGAGWGLGFESSIERKSEHGGAAEMSGSDTYWFNGVPMVKQSDGSYRTEQDAFTVYRQIKSGSKIIGWSAKKDGKTLIYGRSSLLSIYGQNAVEYLDETLAGGLADGSEPVRWWLHSSTDQWGNVIRYSYTIPYATRLGRDSYRHLPSSISYNGNAGVTHTVTFGWEERDDVRSSYAQGVERLEAMRLRRVVVSRVDGSSYTSHYYLLDYTLAAHSQQSLLGAVRRLEVADPASPPTAATESSAASLTLVELEYDDSSTTWDDPKSIKMTGAPAVTVTSGWKFFSLSILVDVNADALPDLVVFNDKCDPENLSEQPDLPGHEDDDDLILDITTYDCYPQHQVFINTRKNPEWVTGPTGLPMQLLFIMPQLVYDDARSQDVTNFYGALHDGFLDALPVAILDLDRDGIAELLKPGDYAQGTDDGWSWNATNGSWLSEWTFEHYQFADLNGDGYPDLVGQSEWVPSSGSAPFLDGSSIPILDPVIDDHASPEFDSHPDASCMDASTGGMRLYDELGFDQNGDAVPAPISLEQIYPEDWVWRHTIHADFNGDGMLDRLISFNFLNDGPTVCASGASSCANTYVQDPYDCGAFDRIYFGDGRGNWIDSGYGIGGQTDSTFVHQVLTTPSSSGSGDDVITYDYTVNHFAAADLDHDGFTEITQYCDGQPFSAYWDRGLDESTGLQPGYQLDGSGCPSALNVDMPLSFFGLSLLDNHYSTVADIDGDGMQDLFYYTNPTTTPNTTVDSDGSGDIAYYEPWADWVGTAGWYENERPVAQARLLRVIQPHGGAEELTWDFSARDSDNQLAINVEHIAEVDGRAGRVVYDFKQGAYADGRFLGFGRMETALPQGATQVQTFFTLLPLLGKPSTEELYDEDGRLKNLRVHVHLAFGASGLPALDGFAPYYNPLARVCEWEFSAGNVGVPLGTDIDDYIFDCETFGDEEGIKVFGGVIFENRPIDAVLRGADLEQIAGDDLALRKELRALAKIGRGQAREVCGVKPGQSQPAPAVCKILAQPQQQDEVVLAPTGELPAGMSQPVSWHKSSLSTLDLSKQGTLSPGSLTPMVLVTKRMYVTEYDYDTTIGHITTLHELRDTSTTADSLIHEYSYSLYSSSFEGAWLIKEVTRNRLGKTYETFDYLGVVNGEWTIKRQTGSGGLSRDLESRGFDAWGRVQSSTDPLGRATTTTFDRCGLVATEVTPDQYGTAYIRDGACRVITENSTYRATTIARVTTTWDGWGRQLSVRENPSVGSTASGPIMIETHAYDANSGSASPAHVLALPEPDGTTTLEKQYVDGFGRVLKVVHCQQGGGGGGSGLDASYGCEPDTEVVATTAYGDSGLVESTSDPHFDGEVAPLTSYEYDEFSRVISSTLPDGTSLGYSYGLGWRQVTDGVGTRSRVEFDTLTETIEVAGQHRGTTERNAFGQVVTMTDEAGLTTSISYDGFNRRSRETFPAVEVLASGAAVATVQSPFIAWTYFDDDQLDTYTDAGGSVWRHSYDSAGRPASVFGPDGAEIKRLSYVDGRTGVRKVVTTDPRLGTSVEHHLDGIGRGWKRVDADGDVVELSYDSRGRVDRRELPWGEVHTIAWSSAGQVLVETTEQDTVSFTVTTLLDAGGRPLEKQNSDGLVVSYEYDLMGRLVAERHGGLEVAGYEYDAAGRATITREAGSQTCWAYDALGRVLLEERGCDPAASPRALSTVGYSYTDHDNLDVVTQGDGSFVDYGYDALGRLVSAQVTDAAGVARGARSWSYDAMGRITRETDELGYASWNAYDGYGRLTSATSPGEGATLVGYTVSANRWRVTTTMPTGEVSSELIDASGRTVERCGADGVCSVDSYVDDLMVSRTRLDASGATLATKYLEYHPQSSRLWRDWEWMSPAEEGARCAGSVPAGCAIGHVETTYTDAGLLATRTDAQGNVTEYIHDAAGGSMLLVGVIEGGVQERWFGYDASYPRIATTTVSDPAGLAADIVTSYGWTRHHRLSGLTRSAAGAVSEVVSYGYDANGRLASHSMTRGGDAVSVSESMDPYGLLLSRVITVSGAAGTVTGALGFSWRDNGQLDSVTYPSGIVVDYNYDAATSRPTNVKLGGAYVFQAQDYDLSARPRRLRYDGGAIVLERTFDSAGREAERRLTGLGAATQIESYGYGADGLLATISTVRGVHSATSSYGYDARGWLVSEAHTADGAAVADYLYSYDLETGLRSGKTVTDAAGGVTAQSYGYDTGNRLATVDAAVIGWDGYGRQTSDALGRGFGWGLADQLLSIEEAGVTLEENVFDASGVRVARATAAGTHYYFSGRGADEVYEHVDAAAGAIEDFVRLPSGTVVAIVDETGAVTPVVKSITGSPYRIGERGAVHHYVDQSGFGETISEHGAFDTELTFHQMLESAADGVYVAGVRTYDASTGRFLSPDPLRWTSSFDPNDAGDFFRYAKHNPIAYTDPTGYSPMVMEDGTGSDADTGYGSSGGCIPMPDGMPMNAASGAETDEAAAAETTGDAGTDEATTSTDGSQVEQGNQPSGDAPDTLESTSEPITVPAGNESAAEAMEAGGYTPEKRITFGSEQEMVDYWSKAAGNEGWTAITSADGKVVGASDDADFAELATEYFALNGITAETIYAESTMEMPAETGSPDPGPQQAGGGGGGSAPPGCGGSGPPGPPSTGNGGSGAPGTGPGIPFGMGTHSAEILDWIQVGADIAGAIPWPGAPVADAVSVSISLLKGDYAGAALGVVGFVPVVGDAFKAGKYLDNVADIAGGARAFDGTSTLVKQGGGAPVPRASAKGAGSRKAKAAAKGNGGKKAKKQRKSTKEDPYQRGKFRKDTRRQVYDRAAAGSPDGKVRDPLTGEEIPFDSDWQMGHKPGWEFRKHKASAKRRGISRKQFLDEYNDPTHYRPETPKTNQGHNAEGSDDWDGWRDQHGRLWIRHGGKWVPAMQLAPPALGREDWSDARAA